MEIEIVPSLSPERIEFENIHKVFETYIAPSKNIINISLYYYRADLII